MCEECYGLDGANKLEIDNVNTLVAADLVKIERRKSEVLAESQRVKQELKRLGVINREQENEKRRLLRPKAYCSCCGVTEVARQRRLCAECKAAKAIKLCRACGLPATELNPFRKTSRGTYYQHAGCHVPYVAKKKECLVKVTDLDRFLRLPDKKVCKNCGEEKLICEFYVTNRFYAYGRCKVCHLKRTNKWAANHMEQVREYNRNYQKNYDRSKVVHKPKMPIILQP